MVSLPVAQALLGFSMVLFAIALMEWIPFLIFYTLLCIVLSGQLVGKAAKG